MKIAVIGAGIFGVTTSLTLSNNGYDVTLFESENDILTKASKCNHNRLHFGYHYPRSIKTAEQSLDGYEIFHEKFSGAILENFPNFYLIEKNGKVNKDDFKYFCDKLKLDYLAESPNNVEVNLDNITFSVKTKEPIYDYDSIKTMLTTSLSSSKVNLQLNTKIKNKTDLENFDVVINTTYSEINKINELFNIEPQKLKLQDVIIPIFKMKSEKIGLTIMDGDYCSIMPKGFEQDTFLLYHVKYSVINQIEGFFAPETWNNICDEETNEKIKQIYEKSISFYPFLKNCKPVSYYRTIRALPINDDDERLSTLKVNKTNTIMLISLLSGKVTTCWLMSEKILKMLNEHTVNR